jgi:hypothetical protein
MWDHVTLPKLLYHIYEKYDTTQKKVYSNKSFLFVCFNFFITMKMLKLTQHIQITFVYKKNYQYTQNQTHK